MGNYPGIGDDSRIGGHKAVDIRPYFERIGIERRGDQGGCEIASAASQIGYGVSVAVAGYETAGHHMILQRQPELLPDLRLDRPAVGDIAVMPAFGLDEFQ